MAELAYFRGSERPEGLVASQSAVVADYRPLLKHLVDVHIAVVSIFTG